MNGNCNILALFVDSTITCLRQKGARVLPGGGQAIQFGAHHLREQTLSLDLGDLRAWVRKGIEDQGIVG